MTYKSLFIAAGISAALCTSVTPALSQQGTPKVRVITTPASGNGNIATSISLNEPAYILAVAVDRDGQVAVLSPETPTDIFRFEPSGSIRLPRSNASISPESAKADGSVLVVASRTPLNFTEISDGRFWDQRALEKLVRYRPASSAANALGRAVTSTGQSFARDYVVFGSVRFARISDTDNCSFGSSYTAMGHGSGLGGYAPFLYGEILVKATASQPGLRLVSLGSDHCGRQNFVTVPYRLLPAPLTQTDSVKSDVSEVSTAFVGTSTGREARGVFQDVSAVKPSVGRAAEQPVTERQSIVREQEVREPLPAVQREAVIPRLERRVPDTPSTPPPR